MDSITVDLGSEVELDPVPAVPGTGLGLPTPLHGPLLAGWLHDQGDHEEGDRSQWQ
jgi:hypothetical protein